LPRAHASWSASRAAMERFIRGPLSAIAVTVNRWPQFGH
jgi:hypothetical protein